MLETLSERKGKEEAAKYKEDEEKRWLWWAMGLVDNNLTKQKNGDDAGNGGGDTSTKSAVGGSITVLHGKIFLSKIMYSLV